MKATVNPVDQHVVTLTIEVPAAEVDKGIKQAVKRIAGQVNIPGFRKGHAPRRILEMNFGKEAILEEAFEVLASQYYSAALLMVVKVNPTHYKSVLVASFLASKIN